MTSRRTKANERTGNKAPQAGGRTPPRRAPFRPRLEVLEGRVVPATRVWDGGSPLDANWATAANWVGDVAPSPGDDLVFVAGAARLANTNNFAADTPFNSVTFSGSGYTLAGNRVRLAAGITTTNVDGVGATNVVNLPVVLAADQTFTSTYFDTALHVGGAIDTAGHTLTIDGTGRTTVAGVIGGAGGLVKNGPGTLLLQAGNTYGGLTTLNAGSVEVVGSFGGPGGTLGSTAAGTVINSGATLRLNSVTVAEPLTISGAGLGGGNPGSGGGAVRALGSFFGNTLTGPITLVGDAVLGLDSGGTLNVNAPVNLGSHILTVNNAAAPTTGTSSAVNFSQALSGGGGLAVNLADTTGTVALTAANTYTGPTVVDSGFLILRSNGTLASTAINVNSGVTNAQGTLHLDNLAVNNPDRLPDTAAITLNGGRLRFGGANSAASTETVGTVTLGRGHSSITSESGTGGSTVLTAAQLFRNPGAMVDFVGANLGGTSKVFFAAAPTTVGNAGGILPYATANTFTTNTFDFATYDPAVGIKPFTGYVSSVAAAAPDDVVRLAASETVAANKSLAGLLLTGTTTVTLNAGVTLTAGAVLTNANSNTTLAGAGTLDLPGTGVTPSEGLFFAAGISPANLNSAVAAGNALVFSGTGRMSLGGGPKAYTGGTTLNSGTLSLGASGALGTGPVTLTGGSFANAFPMSNPVTFNNATVALTANGTLAGTVTLLGANVLNIGSGLTTTVTGKVTGTGSLVKRDAGTLTLSPATASDYTGGTVLAQGTLVVGTANSPLGTGTLTWAPLPSSSASLQTSLVGGVTLDNPVVFNDASGVTTTGNAVTFASPISLMGVNQLSVNGPLTLAGEVSGSGALVASGGSTLSLTGNNTHTGATMLLGGTLLINGNQPASAVGVRGGTLGGTGTLGFLTVTNATDNPGDPPTVNGVQAAAGANFGNGGRLVIQVTGDAAGIVYDQLDLGDGLLALGGTTTLTLDLAGLTAAGTAEGIIRYGSRLGIAPVFNQLVIVNNPNNFAVLPQYTDDGLDLTLVPQESAPSAPPETRVWDGGGADGDWTNALNWVSDVAPNPGDDLLFPGGVSRLATVNNFAANTAFGSITFAGAGYSVTGAAVTLAGGITAANPTGSNTISAAVTLVADQAVTTTYAGATLTLAGQVDTNGHTLTADGSGNATVSGKLTGSGGLVKEGAGTFTLAPSFFTVNDYTGLTTVNEGVLAVSGFGTPLGASGPGQGTVVTAGATLQVPGGINDISEPLTLSGHGVNGAVPGTNGGALITTSGFGTFLGPITLAGDTTVSGSGASFFTLNGAIDLGPHTLTVNNSFPTFATVNAVISGTGNLVINGTAASPSTVVLTAANTYTGTTTVQAGTLSLSGNGTLASTALVVNQGAVLQLDNAGTNNTNRLPDAATVTLNGATLSLIGNNAAGASSSEAVDGVVLARGHSAVSTRTGSGVGGTVTLTAQALTRQAGATVNFSGTNASNAPNLGSPANRILFASAPATVGASSVDGTGIWPFAMVGEADYATNDAVNGVRPFTGYVSSIAAAGPGDTVRLQGVNETVTASKTINALFINSQSSNSVTINRGVTLTLGGGGLLVRHGSGFGASINSGTTGTGTAALTFGAEGVVFANGFFGHSINTQLQGAGGVTFAGRAGNSSLTLNPGTAGNVYTGGTTVNSTSLAVPTTAVTPLGDLAWLITFYGGTLSGSGFGSLTVPNPIALVGGGAGFGGFPSINLTGPVAVEGANTVNVGPAVSVTGRVSGGGRLIKVGSGNLVLAGANDYAGGTILNGGTLTARSADAFGPGTLTLATGTLQTDVVGGLTLANPVALFGANVALGGAQPLTLAGPVTAAGVSTLSANGDVTLSGSVSGAGAPTKAGTGKLVLSGDNGHTGATSVTAGTLVINGSQPNSPTVVTGGTLGGTGATGPIAVAAGLAVEPGDPPAVTGSLAAASADFSNGGVLRVQVQGFTSGAYDQLDLGDGLALLGGTSRLIVDLGGLTTPGRAVGVLRYGSRAGASPLFNDLLIINNPNSFGVGVEYTAEGLNLVIAAGVNATPVNTVPGAQTTIEDTPLVFSAANGNALSVADPDAGGLPVQVSLGVTNGTLTLGGTAGLTFLSGDGLNDANMVFTATLADVNAALDGLTFTPDFDYKGPATLTLSTDDLGNLGLGGPQTDTDAVAITVVEFAPVIDTLTVTPGSIDENSSSTLSGTFTNLSPLDTHTVVITWGDGNSTTLALGVGERNFSAAHTYPDDDGPGVSTVYTISVTVTDDDGLSGTDSTARTVNNVAPAVGLSGPSDGVPGQPRTFTFTAMDPGPIDQAAGFVYTIDWGDGTAQTVARTAGNGAGVKLDHVYTGTGVYIVSVTATDKDGGTGGAATQTATVQTAQLQGGSLAVGGTLGDDTITLSPADGVGGVAVMVNGVSQGSFLPTARILVYGQAGSDEIKLESALILGVEHFLSVPAVLHGGDGDDILNVRGSTAVNALFGDGGNDHLFDGRGRDLLVGGAGADQIQATFGENILIGGVTAHDLDNPEATYDDKLAAVLAILAEWGRTDAGYLTRIGDLGDLLSPSTVDDGAEDVLFGDNTDLDWFFAGALVQDVLRRVRDGEVITSV